MTTELGTSWHSYPSIFNLGHKAVADLFSEPVYIQEKVDGSQFSFGVFGGELKVRSKGKEMDPENPEKLFAKAVATVRELAASRVLVEGWTYRGEAFDKPKHNALTYDRVPTGNVILFDITIAEEGYAYPEALTAAAGFLGLESVPLLHDGLFTGGVETIQQMLERTSVLGGQKIEGVVIKSYSLYGVDKKRLMGKYVSEAFKEVHKRTWGDSNPAGKDIIGRIADSLRTDARFNKAVIHLAERGELEGSPRDIGKLIAELKADLTKEEAEAVKEQLFQWAWGDILRKSTGGAAEWYKARLLEQQFADAAAD